MYTKNQSMRELIDKRKVLIAAHRGTSGGNVVQNTSLAYKNALLHGADMIEVDAIMTTDGVFYAFHNGEEDLELGIDRDIREMSSSEVEELHTLNCMRKVCEQKLEHLEEVLERFRGKCLINIDRSWFYWKEIIALLERMDMKEQLLLKSGVEEQLLQELEESGSDLMYMPIMKTMEDWELVKKYNINVAAAELIFTDLDSDFLKPEFMKELKDAGIAPWVNAITLNDVDILSGLLDDNNAIKNGFDESWGRLMELGFEIIQTDWPALLKEYRNNKFNNK
ncbi:MAG: glycerophosphodiester phosphodiesterase family protein [Eubacteriales bacterium]|nr:glycerophosphodiester phosphodiesterase family protein [Eubacteriales bacterium]